MGKPLIFGNNWLYHRMCGMVPVRYTMFVELWLQKMGDLYKKNAFYNRELELSITLLLLPGYHTTVICTVQDWAVRVMPNAVAVVYEFEKHTMFSMRIKTNEHHNVCCIFDLFVVCASSIVGVASEHRYSGGRQDNINGQCWWSLVGAGGLDKADPRIKCNWPLVWRH